MSSISGICAVADYPESPCGAEARRSIAVMSPAQLELSIYRANEFGVYALAGRRRLTIAKAIALGDIPTRTGVRGWLVEVQIGVSRLAPPVT